MSEEDNQMKLSQRIISRNICHMQILINKVGQLECYLGPEMFIFSTIAID